MTKLLHSFRSHFVSKLLPLHAGFSLCLEFLPPPPALFLEKLRGIFQQLITTVNISFSEFVFSV